MNSTALDSALNCTIQSSDVSLLKKLNLQIDGLSDGHLSLNQAFSNSLFGEKSFDFILKEIHNCAMGRQI